MSGALGPIHYITLKAFAVALVDRTKCKTGIGGPRMILHAHWKKCFSKIEVWLFSTLRDPPVWQKTRLFPDPFPNLILATIADVQDSLINIYVLNS